MLQSVSVGLWDVKPLLVIHLILIKNPCAYQAQFKFSWFTGLVYFQWITKFSSCSLTLNGIVCDSVLRFVDYNFLN